MNKNLKETLVNVLDDFDGPTARHNGMIREILSAIEQEGFVVVPVEPTEAMVVESAYRHQSNPIGPRGQTIGEMESWRQTQCKHIWQAMIAKAQEEQNGES